MTAVIVVFSALAVTLLSAPSSKYVYLEIESDGYLLPEDISLPIERVASVHTRGMDAQLSGIADLSIDAPPEKSTKTNKQTALTISKDPAESSSSLTIEAQGRRGSMTLYANRGTSVNAGESDNKGCSITFGSKSVKLSMSADEILVREANRVTFDPVDFNVTTGYPVSYSIRAANTIGMVQLVSNSSSQVPIAEEEISLTYGSEDKLISILPENKALSELSNTSLSLERTKVKKAIIRGLKDADVVLNLSSDLTLVTGGPFQWSQVLVKPRAAPETGCAFEIVGKGSLSSFKQDSRQLLPSRLSEWISGTPAEKGILGAFAVFIVFFGGIFLKRALEVLAKLTLPEQ